jgi:ABC-type lipoprotein release transport system permease subunit
MIFSMAWRNIWRNKARSIVIMVSVAIGLLAGISVLALYKGMMKSRVRTVIDTETGHLQIHNVQFKKDYAPQFVIDSFDTVISTIRSMPSVKIAAGRTIVQGMLAATSGSAGVQINGVIPGLEGKLSRLNEKIITGRGLEGIKKNQIIIGKKLADKMKLKQGSKLVLTFTDSSENLISAAFRVVGIFQSENAPLDELNVYVTAVDLNQLLQINGYHEIGVLLQNDFDVGSIEKQLQHRFPFLLVESWQKLSPETDLMVKTVDTYSYIIMMIILVALAFGILNTMLMSVLERIREIGMMVALGTSRLRIFLLVLMETVFLTLAGTPLGFGIGYLLVNHYERYGLDLSGMGKEMMASFGFSTMVYPSFPWEKLPGVTIMVITTALVSCLLPALKALKLRPAEALAR